MTDFTAELEQVFGVAPGGETGLVIDTFDGVGFGDTRACGNIRVGLTGESCGVFCVFSVSSCRVSVPE